ncbi:succinoglycan biosynthesis protein exoh [Novosphingobium colocasiae]|uniref:Succinoglycan biosynthesis protein exoh n=1 Tax=Novosphingobium colocasiae TaxID=1256513 RepID=A0A918PBB4_9SPHN|nr:succinoglycan biosynthesis protein exoh [Novosphingobium colocasiae]
MPLPGSQRDVPAETRPDEQARQRRSDAIGIARVLCILGVVYVHAWTGLGGNGLELARGTFQENLRWVLMECFGRSAVPLLGLISGWLVMASLAERDGRRRDWAGHVGRKARTVLLPMVVWNAIALVLVSGTAWLFTLPAPVPHTLGWTIEELLILTRNPDINVQMPFLRDLFVCMVLAPALVRLPARALGLIALAAGIAQAFALGWPIFLRPSILMFFALGMIARQTGAAERVAEWPLSRAVLPFALLLPVKLALEFALADPGAMPAFVAFDLTVRIAAAFAFWRIAWAVARSDARGPLLALEPYAFFLFCAHLTLIWLFAPLIGRLTGPLGSPLYPLFLILQPLLVLGATLAVASPLSRHWPAAARVLSGGRLGRRRP